MKTRKRRASWRKVTVAAHGGRGLRVNQRGGSLTPVDTAFERIAEEKGARHGPAPATPA